VLILTVFIIILISVLCPLRDHSNPRDSRKVLRSAIENRWLFRPTSILRYMGTTEKICPRVNHTTNVLSKSIVSVYLFILFNLIDISVIFFVSLIRQKLFFKKSFSGVVVYRVNDLWRNFKWSKRRNKTSRMFFFLTSRPTLFCCHFVGSGWIR